MNAFQEEIRAAVREEVRPLLEVIKQLLGQSGAADDLTTVTKAAKACGLHPDTVKARYLSKLKLHGAGRLLRISVADLRRVMSEDRSPGGELDDAELERRVVAKLNRRSRG